MGDFFYSITNLGSGVKPQNDKGKTLDIHLRRYDDDFSFLVIPAFTGIYCFLYTEYPDGLAMPPQNDKGE